MPSPYGKKITVHKDFADLLNSDFEAARSEFERRNRKLSFIKFTDFLSDCMESDKKEITVLPVRAGRHAKKVNLDILDI